MIPAEASEIKNSKQVFANLYSGEIFKQNKNPKFRIGDRVRISKFKRKLFDKGFTPNWTEEIFIIDGILDKTSYIPFSRFARRICPWKLL